jgi:hypothetical protein
MRNLIAFQIMTVLLVAGIASAVDTNLVAWYTFDEGTGPTAHDSARTHDGTIYGSAWAAGKIGGAMRFNGTTNYISVPNSSELNITGDITLFAWVNFSRGGNGSDGSQQSIVSKCIGNGAFDNPFDFRTSAQTIPALELIRANDLRHEQSSTYAQVPLNSWHAIAVVASGNTSNFYIDGTLVTMVWDAPHLTSPPVGNTNPMLIGARADGLYFAGLIDDLRIYNRALSAAEIRTIPEPATLLLFTLGIMMIKKRKT